MSNLNDFLSYCANVTEEWLSNNLVEFSPYTSILTESMRYSVFAGGKRLRPALMFASYNIFSENNSAVLPYAAAIEVLHTYSLIHDDLPAMDNDDLRRGKPTNHKVYGEAIAILAGDALLTKAFEFISDLKYNKDISSDAKIRAIYELSLLSGDKGMVAGQVADIEAENKVADNLLVDFIHLNKTAALIRYSTKIGAIISTNNDEDINRLDKFGKNIGLAFQIIDDILDIISDTNILGKNVGSDIEKGKATFPTIYGIEKSKKIADELITEAIDLLLPYNGKADMLKEIALYITKRQS